jgi:hypothetical protein
MASCPGRAGRGNYRGARASTRSVGLVVLGPHGVDLPGFATRLADAAPERVGDLRQGLRATPHEDHDEDHDKDDEEIATHVGILLCRDDGAGV